MLHLIPVEKIVVMVACPFVAVPWTNAGIGLETIASFMTEAGGEEVGADVGVGSRLTPNEFGPLFRCVSAARSNSRLGRRIRLSAQYCTNVRRADRGSAQSECPLLALSGHSKPSDKCPLLEVKRSLALASCTKLVGSYLRLVRD
jgi:hypothetical protein